MRPISLACLALLVLLAAPACYSHHPAGGPYYYAKWISREIPVQPAEPLSRVEALSRPTFYEAYFDDNGRIIRFVEYAEGNARSETTYSYRPDRSFEERNCSGGTLIVTVFANGKEVSSNAVRGGCSIGR